MAFGQLMPRTDFMTVLNDAAMEYLKNDVDALIEKGKIKAPSDCQGHVYPDILKAIDPKLVTWTKYGLSTWFQCT